MIKAILFDLDNTLIDFMAMKRKSCAAAMDAMVSAGLKISKKKALKILFELYERYGIEEQHIFNKFLEKTEGKVNYRIVAHGVIAYRKAKEKELKPYKNVTLVLSKLRKHKLAVISDAPRINAWLRLVETGLDNLFDVVITAGDVRKTKEFNAPFKAALRELKISPNEALMVGDRIERDIIPAKRLGIRTCFARYGDSSKRVKRGESKADFEIDDIKELLEVLK